MQEGEKFSEDRDQCCVPKLTDIKRGITTLYLPHVINTNYIVYLLHREIWMNFELLQIIISLVESGVYVNFDEVSLSPETSLPFLKKYWVAGFFITKNKYIFNFC